MDVSLVCSNPDKRKRVFFKGPEGPIREVLQTTHIPHFAEELYEL